MTKYENDPINQGLRRAFTSARFTVDGQGRVLRGPDEETTPETGTDVPAPPRLPADPGDAVNRAIRRRLTGQG
jgi:hypothetical protein